MILDIIFFIVIGLIVLALLVCAYIYIVAKLVDLGFRAREEEAEKLFKQLRKEKNGNSNNPKV